MLGRAGSPSPGTPASALGVSTGAGRHQNSALQLLPVQQQCRMGELAFCGPLPELLSRQVVELRQTSCAPPWLPIQPCSRTASPLGWFPVSLLHTVWQKYSNILPSSVFSFPVPQTSLPTRPVTSSRLMHYTGPAAFSTITEPRAVASARTRQAAAHIVTD